MSDTAEATPPPIYAALVAEHGDVLADDLTAGMSSGTITQAFADLGADDTTE